MRIVCDAGPLISLSNTCLLWVLERVPMEFYLPPWVVNEVFIHPMGTKHYKLSAVRIRALLRRGTLKEASLGNEGEKLAQEIDRIANTMYYVKKRPLRLVQRGEIEAAALAKMMDNILLIDERTLRMMVEDPQGLVNTLRLRTGMNVHIDNEKVEELQEILGDVLMIRSADLIAYAHEEGLLEEDGDLIEAALYALKFTGCAVSEQEIREYLSE